MHDARREQKAPGKRWRRGALSRARTEGWRDAPAAAAAARQAPQRAVPWRAAVAKGVRLRVKVKVLQSRAQYRNGQMVPATTAAATNTSNAGTVRRRTALRTVAPPAAALAPLRRRVLQLHGRPQRRAPAAVVCSVQPVGAQARHGQLNGLHGLHVHHVAVRRGRRVLPRRAACAAPRRAAPGRATRARAQRPHGRHHAARVRTAAAALAMQQQLEVPPPRRVDGRRGQGGRVGTLVLRVKARTVHCVRARNASVLRRVNGTRAWGVP